MIYYRFPYNVCHVSFCKCIGSNVEYIGTDVDEGVFVLFFHSKYNNNNHFILSVKLY